MYKDYEIPRFWLSYGDALRKYLLKKAVDKSTAEDILHDVYVKIFMHCRRYDFSCEKAGVTNLRSWIFQVCHNTMIDYVKASAKFIRLDNIDVKQTTEPAGEIEQGFINSENLIGQLPPKYASLIFEDIILNTKQADIAVKYGLSLPATKSRIQRGKKMLQSLYMTYTKN